MSGHTTSTELAALRTRVAALEAAQAAARGRGKPRARWLGIVLVVLLAAFPAALSAGHTFDDVPTDAFYHEDVAALAAAGITLGCGGDNFCPDQFVTRGEMAAFLGRGLGRMASDSFFSPTTTDGATIASVQISTQGMEYIRTLATFSVTVPSGQPGADFPCTGTFAQRIDGGATTDRSQAIVQALTNGGAATQYFTLASQDIYLAGAGAHTIDLIFTAGDSTCTIATGNGVLTAEVIPFGATGGAATLPARVPAAP